MFYSVKARFVEARLTEFLQKLTDGTIRGQEPDGAEIVASMQRARVVEPGVVRWSENCYCSPPLAHERETVYDRYFTDIEIAATDACREFQGVPFMDFLADDRRKVLSGSGDDESEAETAAI